MQIGAAMFFTDYSMSSIELARALEERGLKRMNFHFDQQGATVLLNVANFNNLWVAPYAEPEPQLQTQ